VREVRRVGKRIAIGLDGELWLVLHLMIAGRLHWRNAAPKTVPKNVLALFQFSSGVLTLTEAGSERRAALHVAVGEKGLAALDAGGIDAIGASEPRSPRHCARPIIRSSERSLIRTCSAALATPIRTRFCTARGYRRWR